MPLPDTTYLDHALARLEEEGSSGSSTGEYHDTHPATADDRQMVYLLRFEEYCDICDVYAFEGWQDAVIMEAPKVEKFWVEVKLSLPTGGDPRGVFRLRGKNGENKVAARVSDGGSAEFKVRVLRRILDGIEAKNDMGQSDVER